MYMRYSNTMAVINSLRSVGIIQEKWIFVTRFSAKASAWCCWTYLTSVTLYCSAQHTVVVDDRLDNQSYDSLPTRRQYVFSSSAATTFSESQYLWDGVSGAHSFFYILIFVDLLSTYLDKKYMTWNCTCTPRFNFRHLVVSEQSHWEKLHRHSISSFDAPMILSLCWRIFLFIPINIANFSYIWTNMGFWNREWGRFCKMYTRTCVLYVCKGKVVPYSIKQRWARS